MNLSNLKPAPGSVHKEGKRVGRGEGSGKAGTAGKGHKGAQSRAGYKSKAGFEGGQMPMQRRLPKVGFNNANFRTEYIVLNLSRLQQIHDKHKVTDIDSPLLHKLGIVKKSSKIKVLGSGELKTKMNLNVHAVSDSAKTAVEKLGGNITIVK